MPLGGGLGADHGACRGPFFAFDPETDQGADDAAELDRLVAAQVAEVLHLDLAVGVLVNRQGVDHAHGVFVVQPLNSAVISREIRRGKADDDQLDGSDGA